MIDPKPPSAKARELWIALCELFDHASPLDYPNMGLITEAKFYEFLNAFAEVVFEECALWHDRRYIQLRDSYGNDAIVGAHMAAHFESANYFRSGKFSR